MDQAALRPRGSQPRYILPVAWRRRVGVDGLVIVETTRYSVPAQYIGQEVDVLPGLDATLRIFQKGQLIAVHYRPPDRAGVVVDPAHAQGLAQLTELPPSPWREQPLPDVEVRDLAIYEHLGDLEVGHG